MSTTIRPELSEKNKYWIDRHRYYELKHFCLQYPAWKKAYGVLDGLSKRPNDNPILAKLNVVSDPTARCAVTKAYLAERIAMIEDVAEDTDEELASYILHGVTEGCSYDISSAVSDERKKISEKVTDTIAERVSKIDEDELRKDVVNKAKEQIAAKFDNKLDDILADFNSNLSNVSRIYRSIAQTIAGTQNARDVMFKMV